MCNKLSDTSVTRSRHVHRWIRMWFQEIYCMERQFQMSLSMIFLRHSNLPLLQNLSCYKEFGKTSSCIVTLVGCAFRETGADGKGVFKENLYKRSLVPVVLKQVRKKNTEEKTSGKMQMVIWDCDLGVTSKQKVFQNAWQVSVFSIWRIICIHAF